MNGCGLWDLLYGRNGISVFLVCRIRAKINELLQCTGAISNVAIEGYLTIQKSRVEEGHCFLFASTFQTPTEKKKKLLLVL